MSEIICQHCGDEPFYPRCPECGSMPLDALHAMCREPLRQIAQDMCAKRVEADLRFTMDMETRKTRAA